MGASGWWKVSEDNSDSPSCTGVTVASFSFPGTFESPSASVCSFHLYPSVHPYYRRTPAGVGVKEALPGLLRGRILFLDYLFRCHPFHITRGNNQRAASRRSGTESWSPLLRCCRAASGHYSIRWDLVAASNLCCFYLIETNLIPGEMKKWEAPQTAGAA